MHSIIFPSWDKTFGSTYTLGISSKPEQKQKQKRKTKRNSQKKEKSLLSMVLNFERKGK